MRPETLAQQGHGNAHTHGTETNDAKPVFNSTVFMIDTPEFEKLNRRINTRKTSRAGTAKIWGI